MSRESIEGTHSLGFQRAKNIAKKAPLKLGGRPRPKAEENQPRLEKVYNVKKFSLESTIQAPGLRSDCILAENGHTTV